MKKNGKWKRMAALMLAGVLAHGSVAAAAPVTYEKAYQKGDNVASLEARETEVTLESVRAEAKAGYENGRKGFDIDLSGQNFAGSTTLDYSADNADRKYMEVFNNLRTGMDDQTVIIRFKTSSGGLLFGAGVDTGNDAGKNMTFAVESGKFRPVIRNTKKDTSQASGGLKGSFSEGLSDGRWHTVAMSFVPSAGYVNGNIRLVIDGGDDLYAQTGWGSSWGKGGFNQSPDVAYTVFQIGGGGYVSPGQTGRYASSAFNGEIDFITVINRAYSVSELQKITERTGTDVNEPDDFRVMTASGSRNIWLFTGGTETVADFRTSGTTRNYVGLFEDNLRAVGSYIERSRFVFNTARRGADIASVLRNYDRMIADYHPKAVGIMTGASDYSRGTEGIPAFKTALKQLIDKLYEDQKLPFLITPYPSADSTASGQIEAYRAAINEVAGSRTRVVDLSSLNAGQVRSDGSLSPAGHQSVANAIKTTLGIGGGTSFGFTLQDGAYTVAKKLPDGSVAQIEKVTADKGTIYVSVDEQTIAGTRAELMYELTDGSGQKIAAEVPEGKTGFAIEGLKPGTEYTLQVYDAGRKEDGSVKEAYQPVKIVTVPGATGKNLEDKEESGSGNMALCDLLTREEPVTYLFMGDSITHGIVTQGYDNVPQMFAKYLDELGRTEDVVLNTGVSNATIATTLAQKDHRMEQFDPDVVMIMLGTNDTSRNGENIVSENGTTSRGGITVEQFKERYKELVRAIHANREDTGIVLRIPCEMIVDDAHSGYEEKFQSIYDVAEEMREEIPGLNITVVDHAQNWRAYRDNVRNDNITVGTAYGWMVDNVHPNGRGNLAMFQQIIQELGMYVNTSELANYQYALDSWAGTSGITAPVTQRAVCASFAMSALSGYSNVLKEVTLTLTDSDGKSISKTAKYEASGIITIEGLEETKSYTPKVTGKDAINSREISFQAVLQRGSTIASAAEKEALQSELDRAKEMDASLYTEESWKEYCSAVAEAEETMKKEDVTVTEVFTSQNALRLASLLLETAGQDYRDRKEAMNELNRVLAATEVIYAAGQKDYTKESWNAYVLAYQAAKAADESTDTAGLLECIAALVKAENGLRAEEQKAPEKNEPKKLEAPEIKHIASEYARKYVGVKVTVHPVKDAVSYEIYRISGGRTVLAGVTGTGVLTDKKIRTENARYYAVAVAADGTKSSAGAEKKITLAKAIKIRSAKSAGNQVQLTWKKQKGVKRYIIYRSTKKNTGFVKIKELRKNMSGYTDTKVKKNKTYYYKIVIQKKNQVSLMSKAVKIKVK